METRIMGRTGMKVSALGFGGAETGFHHATVPMATVTNLLNGALDAGVNVLDTAECYGDGETQIGRAVGHRRGDYYLFTKVGHGRAAGFDWPDFAPALLEPSFQRSLKRLRTDYVDLLLLHSCPLEVLRDGRAVEALQKFKKSGATRHIGYSGDGQAALWAIESGIFDCLETSVSIADQEAIDLTIPQAQRRGMGVIAKRSIANAAWITGRKPEDSYAVPYWERLRELQYEFLTWDVAASVAVALRFTLSIAGVHTVLVGTKKADRWRENLAIAAQGPLEPALLERIRGRWKAVAGPDWSGLT